MRCGNWKKWATLLLLSLLLPLPLRSSENGQQSLQEAQKLLEKGHQINFVNVPIVEFIRFVSRVCGVNFLFDHGDLNFPITLAAGKPLRTEQVLKALVQMLKSRGFLLAEEDSCYVIYKAKAVPKGASAEQPLLPAVSERVDFLLTKLQYHRGSEIQAALKQLTREMKSQGRGSQKLLDAIESVQWIEGNNSLFYSADRATLQLLHRLITTLDTPPKQVFIELLVVRTNCKKVLDFGLQWHGQSADNGTKISAANQSVDVEAAPSGLQMKSDRFNLGIIGNRILYKGKHFPSLSALIHALQNDWENSIVLNQKIIARDNKSSTIFVGQNIPFAGSVVKTVGHGQQTTANINYKDIGVNLNITPMLGEDDIITLDIQEEITEADQIPDYCADNVSGIHTTKTNMVTCAHVPDRHFLVLSGMMHNTKMRQYVGIPCLGALAKIGALFGRARGNENKSNVLIFVCPHIIHDLKEHRAITEQQQELLSSNSKLQQEVARLAKPANPSDSGSCAPESSPASPRAR